MVVSLKHFLLEREAETGKAVLGKDPAKTSNEGRMATRRNIALL